MLMQHTRKYNCAARYHYPMNFEYSYWKKKKTSVVLVRQRTIPIERSPPVSEASANFSG
jgi:hypothetical protein